MKSKLKSCFFSNETKTSKKMTSYIEKDFQCPNPKLTSTQPLANTHCNWA